MKHMNQRVEELKESETMWEKAYNNMYKEFMALKLSPERLCANCKLRRAQTPEGKTFEPCKECGETREGLRKQGPGRTRRQKFCKLGRISGKFLV